MRLDAPVRPGFVRRFVNGNPSRIQRMETLGYALVSDPAEDGVKRTAGMGTRIARHAGRDEDGRPIQAVLMETPEEEYAYGVADREEARKPFEEAINRSQDTTAEVEGAYTPATKSTIRHSG